LLLSVPHPTSARPIPSSIVIPSVFMEPLLLVH
jgi:hypothetical protein